MAEAKPVPAVEPKPANARPVRYPSKHPMKRARCFGVEKKADGGSRRCRKRVMEGMEFCFECQSILNGGNIEKSTVFPPTGTKAVETTGIKNKANRTPKGVGRSAGGIPKDRQCTGKTASDKVCGQYTRPGTDRCFRHPHETEEQSE